jgi:hypothetical protein
MGNNLLILFLLFLSIQGMSQTEIDLGKASSNQRFIVFVNGNRGAKFNKVTTDNALHLKDPTGYWYNYDDTIISRFQPIQAIYFDGHHPVSTSMHRTTARFLKAYFFSRFCWFSRKSRWVLNTKFNEIGFKVRVENGKIAGQNLLAYLRQYQLLDKQVYGENSILYRDFDRAYEYFNVYKFFFWFNTIIHRQSRKAYFFGNTNKSSHRNPASRSEKTFPSNMPPSSAARC